MSLQKTTTGNQGSRQLRPVETSVKSALGGGEKRESFPAGERNALLGSLGLALEFESDSALLKLGHAH